MKPLLLIPLLALTACCPKSFQSKVVYRIPPDKQEAAAKMVVDLTKAVAGNNTDRASWVYEAALKTAQETYGEPVVMTP